MFKKLYLATMPPEESVVNGESSDARLLANRDTPSMESLSKHGRQTEYHQIFKSIPEDELLIECIYFSKYLLICLISLLVCP